MLVQPLDGNPYSPTGSGSDLIRLSAGVLRRDRRGGAQGAALARRRANLTRVWAS
ncbi:MAG: hypothetical protein R2734_14565 [Nocardioides sp.]